MDCAETAELAGSWGEIAEENRLNKKDDDLEESTLSIDYGSLRYVDQECVPLWALSCWFFFAESFKKVNFCQNVNCVTNTLQYQCVTLTAFLDMTHF